MKALVASLLLFLAAGCTTPPEIKQALIAKDQAYIDNQRLMSQYGERVGSISERHRAGYRFVQTRLMPDLAVQRATTDPKAAGVPDDLLAQDDAEKGGPEVVTLINDVRLQRLPERKDTNGRPVFHAGTRTMPALWQQLSDLIALVEQGVEKDSSPVARADMAVFDKYQTNLQALRRIMP